MNRLLSTMRWDMRLQFRNGFYYASTFVAVFLIIVVSQLNVPNLDFILPAFIFGNILTNTFYFIAGLVLLEKGEGTLEGLVVTPLRDAEYLLAKVITLVILSILETAVVVVAVYGLGLNWLWLLAGILLLGALYALSGFIFVARYDSINEFLFPSVIATAVLSIPVFSYLGLDSWLFYLHPMQAPLLLLRAAFTPVAPWQLVYGVVYALLWCSIAFYLARRAFYRFVVLKQGARRGGLLT